MPRAPKLNESGDAPLMVPPVSKTQYVVNRIRHEISVGLITAGDSLVQSEVAERYGVSPTPVREALRILSSEGTITYVPNQGATVRQMSYDDVEDLYLMRAEVEGLATELATRRMTDESMAAIQAAHKELLDRTDYRDHEALSLLNRSLHFAIYRAGSPVVSSTIDTLWTLFPPEVTIWRDQSVAKSLMADHRKIVDALSKGDAPRARKEMAAHVLHAASLRRAEHA